MAANQPRKRVRTSEQKAANHERHIQAISDKLNAQRTAEKSIHNGFANLEAVMAQRLHQKVLTKELTPQQARRIKGMFGRRLANARTHTAGNAQELDLMLQRLANRKERKN